MTFQMFRRALSRAVTTGLLSAALCISVGAVDYLDSGITNLYKLTQIAQTNILYQEPLENPQSFFTNAPSITAPYSSGQLREDIVQRGLSRLNNMRWLAGLASVSLNDTYGTYAQNGALVLAAGNVFSHYPPKPEGMDDALYQSGYYGTSHSNLAYYYGYRPAAGPISFAVDSWLDDSDAYNVSALGHRRWYLNPAMAQTGFGCAVNSGQVYTVGYSFDENAPAQTYDFVGWPASGNFPSDVFGKDCAWSISLNPSRYATPVKSNIFITMTETATGKTWTFSGTETYTIASSGSYFNVDRQYMGIPNCIIFRPDGITTYEGVYSVSIYGITDRSGHPVSFNYYVNFFNSDDRDAAAADAFISDGLEWALGEDDVLHIYGTHERGGILALASYQDGKMLDISYTWPKRMTAVDLSVDLPDGALVKLFWLNEDVSPLEGSTCWSKQF